MPCDSPPYCHGTGGWCDCNCRCCPPDPCCSSITVRFECGTTQGSWDGPPPNNGCPCGVGTSFRVAGASAPVDFPEFSYEPLASDDGEFVFALANGCSIPCATVSVTVTTTGCCLELLGNTIYVIGNGTVSASISGSADPLCGTLTAKINGGSDSEFLNDCEIVSVTLENSEGECCSCCEIDKTCGRSSPQLMRAAAITYRQSNIEKGSRRKTLRIDKQKLLEKAIKRQRIKKSKPTS